VNAREDPGGGEQPDGGECPRGADQNELYAYQFVVADEEAGQRLDRYLVARQLPFSRSLIRKHIDAGCVSVNGQTVNGQRERPARRLKHGDVVAYAPPAVTVADLVPEAIALSVLYEDSHLIVVDKPAGMVVHPAPGHARGTLVAALLAHCDDLSGVGGELRPGIVHRLDKLTSGVMVAAKSDAAHRHLALQFKEHSIERRYLALVGNQLQTEKGTYRTRHSRHPTDRKRFTSRTGRGRVAVTHYRLIERLSGACLVEAVLETGRTHQVRVHFADHRHPLVGDTVYGRAPADLRVRRVGKQLGRQALHAAVLAFDHPASGQRLRFVSPLPADMRRALAELRSDSDD